MVLSASKRAIWAVLKSFFSSDSRSLVPNPLWIIEECWQTGQDLGTTSSYPQV